MAEKRTQKRVVGRSAVRKKRVLSITLIDSHPSSPHPFYTNNHPRPYSAPSPSTSAVSHVYASFRPSAAEAPASSPELPATRYTPP